MTIKEVENRTGLARANIRFYEAEGLIAPRRGENGYRVYSPEDVRELERIRLLRSLDIPLDTIRRLQLGEKTLEQVLTAQLEALGDAEQNRTRQQALCQRIRASGVSYAALEPETFETEPLPEQVVDLRLPLQLPLRRFAARLLDLALWGLPGYWILMGIADAQWGQKLVISLLVMPWTMLLAGFAQYRVEPWLLHRFGATPGKAMLGLYVTDASGGKLGLEEARERAWCVYSRGMGLCLPVYSLVRLWKSFTACCQGNTYEELNWESWTQERLRLSSLGRLDRKCVLWMRKQLDPGGGRRKWRLGLRWGMAAVLAVLVLWCAWLFRPVEVSPVRGDIRISELALVTDEQGRPDAVRVEYVIPPESELYGDFAQLIGSLGGRYSLRHYLPELYPVAKEGRSVSLDYGLWEEGSLTWWTVCLEETAWLQEPRRDGENLFADVWFPGWSLGAGEAWFARLDALLAQADQYRSTAGDSPP